MDAESVSDEHHISGGSVMDCGHENNIAEPKQISGLALHLIFHRFSPFNCCLYAVLWLDKGGYPEHSHSVVFCRRVLLNLSCVWILF